LNFVIGTSWSPIRSTIALGLVVLTFAKFIPDWSKHRARVITQGQYCLYTCQKQ